MSHVRDKLLLTDARNRKSVLMETLDRRSKRVINKVCGLLVLK